MRQLSEREGINDAAPTQHWLSSPIEGIPLWVAKLRSEKIGFVFQFFNIVPNLTALENIQLSLMFGGFPTPKLTLFPRPEGYYTHFSAFFSQFTYNVVLNR